MVDEIVAEAAFAPWPIGRVALAGIGTRLFAPEDSCNSERRVFEVRGTEEALMRRTTPATTAKKTRPPITATTMMTPAFTVFGEPSKEDIIKR